MTKHWMLAAAGVLLLVTAGCGSSSTDTAATGSAAAANGSAAPTEAPPPDRPDLPAADASADAASPLSRLVPTFKGEAQLGYLPPVAQNRGSVRVTRMTVKNLSNAAIAGLTVDEIGVDTANAQVSRAQTFRHATLRPGEVVEVVLEVPVRPGMVNTRYEFKHANGTIKPVPLKSIDDEAP